MNDGNTPAPWLHQIIGLCLAGSVPKAGKRAWRLGRLNPWVAGKRSRWKMSPNSTFEPEALLNVPEQSLVIRRNGML